MHFCSSKSCELIETRTQTLTAAAKLIFSSTESRRKRLFATPSLDGSIIIHFYKIFLGIVGWVGLTRRLPRPIPIVRIKAPERRTRTACMIALHRVGNVHLWEVVFLKHAIVPEYLDSRSRLGGDLKDRRRRRHDLHRLNMVANIYGIYRFPLISTMRVLSFAAAMTSAIRSAAWPFP